MNAAFDTVGGLPVHAFVVHAAVVLVPLTALGTVAMAVRRSLSRRFGPLVVGFGAVAVVAALVARSSGQYLAQRVGTPAEHAQFGGWLPAVAGVLFVGVLALWLLDRGIPTNRSRPLRVLVLAGALVVVAAVATALTAVVAYTGVAAVWS